MRKHRHRNHVKLLNTKEESLSTSHQKQIALLEERIAQVTDPNIQRMRRQQIANAEADYIRRIQELEKGTEKSDITAELVAYGILEVNE